MDRKVGMLCGLMLLSLGVVGCGGGGSSSSGGVASTPSTAEPVVYTAPQTLDFEGGVLPQGLGGDFELNELHVPVGSFYSLSSPALGDGESACSDVTVTGMNVLAFDYKVSTENGDDYFQVYVDDVLVLEASGEVDWTRFLHHVDNAGESVVKWCYEKAAGAHSGLDTVFVDNIALSSINTVGPFNFEDGVLPPSFTMSGDAGWDIVANGDPSVAMIGNYSLGSENIADNDQACFALLADDVSSLEFQWQSSSEATFDHVFFYLDGVGVDALSGLSSWKQESYLFEQGEHEFKWCFIKDGSISSYDDQVYVDEIHIQ